MLEEMTAINSVALARDRAHFISPQKLEDVDLEILNAKLFAGGDRFGVAFNTESSDSIFFERTQKKSAARAEIENFRATGKVGNVPAMKLEHLIVGETELIRIEAVSFEKVGFRRVKHWLYDEKTVT